MVKIYFLGEFNSETKGYAVRMDRNYYNFLEFLKKNSKYEIIFIENKKLNNLKNIINKNDIIICTCKSLCNNLILFMKNLNNIIIFDNEDVRCRCSYKCLGVNNNCRWNYIINYIKECNPNYVLFRYKTYITNQLSQSRKTFQLPHYIDNNIFYNKHLHKKYDICLYGYDDKLAYPFRNRLFKLLSINNDKFNIKKIEFPGWTKRAYKSGNTGQQLSEIINESWITIATKSINNLLLKKYIEIAMSNSIICGDFPDLETNYWNNCMIYIDNSMSDDEIIKKITLYLNNKNKLKQMANDAYDITNNKFTYKHGLNDFENIIDIISKENKLN